MLIGDQLGLYREFAKGELTPAELANWGGICNAVLAETHTVDDREDVWSAAETAAVRALSLAPKHAWAHYLMGSVRIFHDRGSEGISECERALVLDSNLASAGYMIAIAKIILGRAVESKGLIYEALRLSPRDTLAANRMGVAGAAQLFLGRDEEAPIWQHLAIETNRNDSISFIFLSAALAQLGLDAEAREAAETLLVLYPTFTIWRFRQGASGDNLIYLAQCERLYEGLRKAGVPEG